MLKKANVHVEEDLSKRTRENRAELRKFMRQVSTCIHLYALVHLCAAYNVQQDKPRFSMNLSIFEYAR